MQSSSDTKNVVSEMKIITLFERFRIEVDEIRFM